MGTGKYIGLKMVDFGLSTVAKTATKCSGTPVYMAPEILKRYVLQNLASKLGALRRLGMIKEFVSGRVLPYTEKADVYPVGVVLFNIKTKKVPFSGKDYMELAKKVVDSNCNVSFPTNCKINPKCREFIKLCLTKEPDHVQGCEITDVDGRQWLVVFHTTDEIMLISGDKTKEKKTISVEESREYTHRDGHVRFCRPSIKEIVATLDPRNRYKSDRSWKLHFGEYLANHPDTKEGRARALSEAQREFNSSRPFDWILQGKFRQQQETLARLMDPVYSSSTAGSRSSPVELPMPAPIPSRWTKKAPGKWELEFTGEFFRRGIRKKWNKRFYNMNPDGYLTYTNKKTWVKKREGKLFLGNTVSIEKVIKSAQAALKFETQDKHGNPYTEVILADGNGHKFFTHLRTVYTLLNKTEIRTQLLDAMKLCGLQPPEHRDLKNPIFSG